MGDAQEWPVPEHSGGWPPYPAAIPPGLEEAYYFLPYTGVRPHADRTSLGCSVPVVYQCLKGHLRPVR